MKLIEDGRNFGKKSIEMELTSNKNYTLPNNTTKSWEAG
jgi:hypothetical protein